MTRDEKLAANKALVGLATKRWDRYTRFAKEPAPMLAWFAQYMVGA